MSAKHQVPAHAGDFTPFPIYPSKSKKRNGKRQSKAKGRQVGRRPTNKDDIPAIFYKHYPAYIAGQMNVSELARICDLSRPTVYKYLKMVG